VSQKNKKNILEEIEPSEIEGDAEEEFVNE